VPVVYVETSLDAEYDVCVQKARTYCKAIKLLDKLCHWIRRHTNFPGLREERRHVVVSVALQLKHHRCTPSPSFLFASSVKTTSIVLILGKN
jgi:hypothetical protein